MGIVCACLVVAIHVGNPEAMGAGWWVAKLLSNGICRIAVPFFFVAAGFFLAGHTAEPKWWARELGKRMRSLLVPFVSWSALYTVFGLSLVLSANALHGEAWTRNLQSNCADVLRLLGLDLFTYPMLIPLWFIRCLLLLVVLAPLPVAVIGRKRNWGLALLAVLWIVYGWGRTWGDVQDTPLQFWRVTISLEGVFYFTLGLFMRRWPMTLHLSKAYAWGLLVTSLGCFALTIAAKNEFLPAAFQARNVGTALGLLAVWRLMPSAPWPRWLTGAAFPCILMHMFVINVGDIATKTLPCLPAPRESVFIFLAFTNVAIVASIAGAWVLRRIFPRTAALLFGGR